MGFTEKIIILFVAYFVIISIVAAALTILDKKYAKAGAWRIKESTLMTVSALGGAVAMLFVMKKIRHKTKHNLFMIGIPIIIVIHIVMITAAFLYFCR